MPIPRFMNIRRWKHGEAEKTDNSARINDASVSAIEAEAAARKENAKARRTAEQEAKRVRLSAKRARKETERQMRAARRIDDEIWKDELTRQVISICRGSQSDILAKISRECGVKPAKAFRRISRSGMLESFLGLESYHSKARSDTGVKEAHGTSAMKPMDNAQQSGDCMELAALIASKRTIKAKELLKMLERTGFITIRDGEGSHVIARNELNGRISVISVHNPGSELDRSIIKETALQLGINLSKGAADSSTAE
jgi:predicted RNA binding protein YcfA (HicA-like mRNA interferase family)